MKYWTLLGCRVSYMVAGFLIILTGCSGPCGDFEKAIDEALTSEGKVTAGEFAILRSKAEAYRKDLENCYPQMWVGNDFDDSGLIKAIRESGKYQKLLLRSAEAPKIEHSRDGNEIAKGDFEQSGMTIIPKLYLERSGSMLFYDKPGGRGQFKANLVKILNEFSLTNPEKSLVYIVNDSVYDFQMSFQKFIRLSDIFADTKIGDASYTDFDEIFRTLTEKNGEDEISIFASDFIYSTTDSRLKNPERIASEVRGLMTNVFNIVGKNYSFLVIKFNGDYIGTYYDYQEVKHTEYNGLRSYYIGFFALNEVMKYFLTDPTYKRITSFEDYKLYENFFLFQSYENALSIDYSVLLNDPKSIGRFRQSSDELKLRKRVITELEDVAEDKISGKFQLAIALDLEDYFLDTHYIANTKNYKVEALDQFRIVEVVESNEKTGFTHKLVLATEELSYKNQDITISFVNRFPQWMIDSSTLDDRDPNAPGFAERTFAFEGMMRGIYDAYYKDENEKYYEITIKLNN
ncbi:MAG: hypothetical protein AAGA64_06415 [Bacteroidota bacterium]